MPLVAAPLLREFTARLFQAAGVPPDTAALVAQILVESDLLGHESHGVMRVRQYLGDIRAGRLIPDAQPAIERESPTTAVVDGQWGFGLALGAWAADRAIQKATVVGLAAVTLRRANHLGRLGSYVQRAAERQLIGLAVANYGRATAPPYGGREPRFGTNPWAFAVPSASFPPLVLDFATSRVAWGRLHVTAQQGERFPEGWVTDREGRPLTDPAELEKGWMFVPFGGHKGAGLMFLADILGGVLSGQGCPSLPGAQRGNGTLFLVLNPAAFQPPEEFLHTMDQLLQAVKATPPAPGFDEVLLPGERGQRLKQQRLREGIPIPDEVWIDLQEEARRWGVRALADEGGLPS